MALEAHYRLELLAKHHDREGFTCGVFDLDGYLKTQASQDVRRKANAVFVLVSVREPGVIVGYFTLCAYSLAPGLIPEAAKKHIPKYPLVSATLLGRLAIRRDMQGMGLGSLLLSQALQKAYDSAAVVGSTMVVVDAIDQGAARFYELHGFIKLPESMRLVLEMAQIAKLRR